MLPSTTKGSGVYEYNGFNQLVSLYDSATNSNCSYTYDADGLRQSKTVNGVTTNHIWDGMNMVAETDGNNAVKSVYTRGRELISSKNGTEVTYYLHNGHGDVNMLMNENGSITKTYNYDAFGVEQDKVSNDTNPFRYCGEYYDKETDNIYLRARYYAPLQGRFTTEDPAEDGLNWYSYCGGNPVAFVDPSGYEMEGDEKYGTSSKVYISLVILGEAWDAMPDYRYAIEEIANEIRYIANTNGVDKIENIISAGLISGAMARLNTVEQILSAGYWQAALSVNYARDKADKETFRIYNDTGEGTDMANAFKHIYWSALATNEIGGKMTRLFTNAHEFGWYAENLNDIEAMKMDLHNNQLGRNLAERFPVEKLSMATTNSIAMGEAAVIRNGKCVYSYPSILPK